MILASCALNASESTPGAAENKDGVSHYVQGDGHYDEAHHKRQYAMAKLTVVGVSMSRLGLKKGKKR